MTGTRTVMVGVPVAYSLAHAQNAATHMTIALAQYDGSRTAYHCSAVEHIPVKTTKASGAAIEPTPTSRSASTHAPNGIIISVCVSRCAADVSGTHEAVGTRSTPVDSAASWKARA
eukprot:6140310-Prymnesium_polylepis.1